MDEKQYVTYEIICCTFLLGLVNEGRDPNSKLKSHLQQALAEKEDERDMNYLIEELNARGGQEQLIMFLTGPAGAGKSTTLKVAQTFLYEFCLAIGWLWSDSTFFLLTAYTG